MFNYKKISPTFRTFFITIIFFFAFNIQLFAQATEEAVTEDDPEALIDFMEDSMHEIDFYALEELLDVEVEVASLFAEDERVVGSMVSSITSDQWKRMGARRTYEALNNELSVVTYWSIMGYRIIAIRGYATNSSMMGTAFLLDGTPLNEFMMGGMAQTPNFGLGTLDRIEVIKGPGSAIYGSDAFHGVVSMKTFESDKDFSSVEIAGAYPLYGDANVKISQGFAGDKLRINAAASTSGQPDQDREYEYEPNNAPGTTKYGERDEAYKTHTGVLKFNFKPADKLKAKIGTYVNYGDYKNFPGVAIMPNKETLTIESLEEHDYASVETLFLMGNGSVVYELPRNVSVEASGYYFWFEHNAAIMADYFGTVNYQDSIGSRTGANLIIKQPDNDFNLQWLIAYSFTFFNIISVKQGIKNYNPSSVFTDEFGIGIKKEIQDAYYDGKTRTIHSTYAQTKWGVIKNSLYLVLGGRLDNYDDYGNQVTPRAGLIFLPTEKSAIKALYGRAFRAAVASELYGIYGYSNGNTDLEPETIDIYEFIFMYKEKKWKIVLNGYYSEWKNGIVSEFNEEIISAPIGEYVPPFNMVNKGKNESYGGECSFFYTLEPFALDIGFSYVKSRAFDVERIDLDSLSVYTLGEEEYAAFPEYTANAGLYYTLSPLNVNFYLNNRFYFGMKETHYNANADADDLPLYWRMNLNVSKTIGKELLFTLDIRNMLNRKNYIPSPYGEKDGYEEPGISVLLRVGYRL